MLVPNYASRQLIPGGSNSTDFSPPRLGRLHLARVQGSFVINMPPYYDEIERWLDQTKGHIVAARHRLLLHNDFGVDLREEIFGNFLSEQRLGRVEPNEDVCLPHVSVHLTCEAREFGPRALGRGVTLSR